MTYKVLGVDGAVSVAIFDADGQLVGVLSSMEPGDRIAVGTHVGRALIHLDSHPTETPLDALLASSRGDTTWVSGGSC